jgi:hypothetical protein
MTIRSLGQLLHNPELKVLEQQDANASEISFGI